MAKRGRKPKKDKNYFREEQEKVILEYIATTNKTEKNKLYVEEIEPVFTVLIESIIRRYNLYVPDESFDDIFNDTLSFLLTKLDKFKPGEYKAYSYYGTICKNYLIGRINNFKKQMERNPLYDSVSDEFMNNVKYSYHFDTNDSSIAEEIIKKLVIRIKDILENEKDQLKDSEIKVGNALIELFENWDEILSNQGSNKLNKSIVLFFLREHTGLDTISIRNNMKKFRREFLLIKDLVVG